MRGSFLCSYSMKRPWEKGLAVLDSRQGSCCHIGLSYSLTFCFRFSSGKMSAYQTGDICLKISLLDSDL